LKYEGVCIFCHPEFSKITQPKVMVNPQGRRGGRGRGRGNFNFQKQIANKFVQDVEDVVEEEEEVEADQKKIGEIFKNMEN